MLEASYEEATDKIFSLDKFADTTTSYIANIIKVVKITTIIQYYLLHLQDRRGYQHSDGANNHSGICMTVWVVLIKFIECRTINTD